MRPYLLVSGDFVRTGGMDMANFALASYLARRGAEVHLVAHRVASELTQLTNVIVHRAPKPARSYLLGAPFLDRAGRYWAAKITARRGAVIANGGNCRWHAVNWVHYVHAAYTPDSGGGALRALKGRWAHRRFLADERRALRGARVVITNSERTRRDVVERIGVAEHRVHTVCYGTDPHRCRPPTRAERADARARLAWPGAAPVVTFIGGLGDRRKGFDTVFEAWNALCADSEWDANLAVVGTGSERAAWQLRASRAGLAARMWFLGSRADVVTILWASDALVAPTRYEPYGLGVQEALCCGLPAYVTRDAGVAERYTTGLHDLLIPDPNDAADLASRLRAWRVSMDYYRVAVRPLSEQLRAHTWDAMAANIESIVGAHGL